MRFKNLGVRFLFVLLCSLAGLISTAKAQVANVIVQGTVKDPSGAAVPNATVTATSTQTGLTKTGTSDQEGRYSILDVPPGIYNVQAVAQGFATTEERNREFLVGTTVAIDFSMQVSSVSQTVEVNAESTTVDVTQSQVSTMVNPAYIDNLPTISRAFSDLAALSPGVLVGTTSGTVNNGQSISVNGATAFQTGYIVDGTVTENDRTSGSILNFAQDWIQEFSVISQMPTAEYGQASGGIINAVTRSGSNAIHGRIYEFLQNSALNSAPWANPAVTAVRVKPQANQYRTGGMVGGPLKKDKLFYFIGFEYYFNNQAVNVSIPTAFLDTATGDVNGAFPITTRYTIGLAKLNYTINTKNTLWLRWNYQFNSTINQGLSPSQPIGAATHAWAPQDIYAGAWDWTISPTTFNEVRSNFNRNVLYAVENCVSLLGPYTGSTALYPGFAQYGAGDPIGYYTALSYPSISSSFNPRCGTFAAGGTNAGSKKGPQGVSEWHLDEVFTHVSGNHTLKFGFSPHWYALNSYADYRNRADPAAQISGLLPFTFNPASETPPVNANGTLNVAASGPSTLPTAYAGSFQTLAKNYLLAWSWGFFAQDSWRTKPNLTLNLGIRYDLDRGNIAMDQFTPANLDHPGGVYGDVAPRFGFAWTPFKDKTTVIRGGLGIFYDKNTFNIYGAFLSDAAQAIQNFNLTANKATQNPYCFGNTACAGAVPAIDQVYVDAEMAYALNNYTIPAFPAPGNTQTILFGNMSTAGCTVTTPTPTCVIVPSPTYTQGGTAVEAPIGVTYDIAKNYTLPGNVQASVGVAHQFGPISFSEDFNYLHGFHLAAFQDSNVNPAVQFLNGVPDPAGNPAINLPLNPQYTQILTWNSNGYSVDYSLRTSIIYRDKRGDSAQVAYSLGWAWDDNETQNGIGTGTAAENPFSLKNSYGPSSNDARNILNVSGTAKVPFGILVSPIFQFNSALPYTATTSAVVAGCPFYYSFCYPAGYSQNSLRGGNTVLANMRLSKVVKFGETRAVTVFAEGYNLANKANHGTSYNASVTSTSLTTGFGTPTNVVTAGRQFQFGARFDF